MPCRVLLVTQWFDPEPTIKGLSFARALAQRGFTVEVLTGFPNYPSGRLYPGYRIRPFRPEVVDGVRVSRVALYPSHDNSAIRRVLNYGSFGLAALLYGCIAAGRADVIYAYHPPLTVGIAAVLMGTVRRRPVLYDIQDMWPDTLRATGMIRSPRLLRLVDAACRWVYRHVDHIVVLSPGFKRLLESRGVPPSKVDVIYNWTDDAVLRGEAGALPEAFPSGERFRVVFAGNMGKAQALESVLEAAALLQARGSRACFVLIGGGVEVHALERLAADKKLANVVFLPPVPMARIGPVLRAADALLVHLRRDPLFTITIPSKTQAYMAVGRPLVLAVEGDAADLVSRSMGGVLAVPEDPSSLADAIEKLAGMPAVELNEMGRSAARFYHDHLSIERGVDAFAASFERMHARRAC
jgi:colanic acid biosynthesis glycosyl transferase WcaI